MKRGTKEFHEMQKAFELSAKKGAMGYMSSNMTKDDFNSTTFYENGEVNMTFRAFMAGYSAGKSRYQESK